MYAGHPGQPPGHHVPADRVLPAQSVPLPTRAHPPALTAEQAPHDGERALTAVAVQLRLGTDHEARTMLERLLHDTNTSPQIAWQLAHQDVPNRIPGVALWRHLADHLPDTDSPYTSERAHARTLVDYLARNDGYLRSLGTEPMNASTGITGRRAELWMDEREQAAQPANDQQAPGWNLVRLLRATIDGPQVRSDIHEESASAALQLSGYLRLGADPQAVRMLARLLQNTVGSAQHARDLAFWRAPGQPLGAALWRHIADRLPGAVRGYAQGVVNLFNNRNGSIRVYNKDVIEEGGRPLLGWLREVEDLAERPEGPADELGWSLVQLLRMHESGPRVNVEPDAVAMQAAQELSGVLRLGAAPETRRLLAWMLRNTGIGPQHAQQLLARRAPGQPPGTDLWHSMAERLPGAQVNARELVAHFNSHHGTFNQIRGPLDLWMGRFASVREPPSGAGGLAWGLVRLVRTAALGGGDVVQADPEMTRVAEELVGPLRLASDTEAPQMLARLLQNTGMDPQLARQMARAPGRPPGTQLWRQLADRVPDVPGRFHALVDYFNGNGGTFSGLQSVPGGVNVDRWRKGLREQPRPQGTDGLRWDLTRLLDVAAGGPRTAVEPGAELVEATRELLGPLGLAADTRAPEVLARLLQSTGTTVEQAVDLARTQVGGRVFGTALWTHLANRLPGSMTDHARAVVDYFARNSGSLDDMGVSRERYGPTQLGGRTLENWTRRFSAERPTGADGLAWDLRQLLDGVHDPGQEQGALARTGPDTVSAMEVDEPGNRGGVSAVSGAGGAGARLRLTAEPPDGFARPPALARPPAPVAVGMRRAASSQLDAGESRGARRPRLEEQAVAPTEASSGPAPSDPPGPATEEQSLQMVSHDDQELDHTRTEHRQQWADGQGMFEMSWIVRGRLTYRPHMNHEFPFRDPQAPADRVHPDFANPRTGLLRRGLRVQEGSAEVIWQGLADRWRRGQEQQLPPYRPELAAAWRADAEAQMQRLIEGREAPIPLEVRELTDADLQPHERATLRGQYGLFLLDDAARASRGRIAALYLGALLTNREDRESYEQAHPRAVREYEVDLGYAPGGPHMASDGAGNATAFANTALTADDPPRIDQSRINAALQLIRVTLTDRQDRTQTVRIPALLVLDNIQPGEQIFIDYGDPYVRTMLARQERARQAQAQVKQEPDDT
jgi:hypothetical protein